MGLHRVDVSECSHLVQGLSSALDFDKDLPANVFIREFEFWFAERPLLSHIELLSGFISKSLEALKSDVFVKFSGRELLAGSCVRVDRNNVEQNIEVVEREYLNFLDGKVGYPIVIFSEGYEWIYFESAFEEIGVIAVNKLSAHGGLVEYLESNFITKFILFEWAASDTAERKIANAFLESYHRL